jgi:Cu-processing system permease protein
MSGSQDTAPATTGGSTAGGGALNATFRGGRGWSRSARQVLLIAGITWREGVRKRMLLIGFILTLVFVGLFGLGTYFTFRNWQSGMGGSVGDATQAMGAITGSDTTTVMRDLAAYQLLSFGAFIASFLGAMLVVFAAAGMVSGDAENGTLQTIVTRPLVRAQILAGRYLGYASIFVAYLVLLVGSLILLIWGFSGYAPPAPAQTLAFLALQGLLLLGIVAVGTTLWQPVATGILAFMAFGVAFIGGVVEQIGGFIANGTAKSIGSAVSYVFPSDHAFRMALSGLAPQSSGGLLGIVDEMGPFGRPAGPTAFGIAYAVLYLAVCLVGAGLLFKRKDL